MSLNTNTVVPVKQSLKAPPTMVRTPIRKSLQSGILTIVGGALTLLDGYHGVEVLRNVQNKHSHNVGKIIYLHIVILAILVGKSDLITQSIQLMLVFEDMLEKPENYYN
ncbi:hypothetical protein PGT21_021818 [Puccinia graminis f. sp. tritici]|uniref:Uncharacterized protein n=1 Tax=Puccinia graminis f. sp. tritici TaxID=56615 RepID=A0A5B0P7M3_PUCGR|nr:hypothetical protein PGT21_021818 [Puccinia graminis f. sp. tritici]